ncbi:MAG: transposase [Verrucomicrobia subdivision 3 bacterium]|nr:transposase [Limisphaerales bacterium]
MKTGWQVHAYVLMPNHFHLVVETPPPNLVAGMKWLLGTYTSRFNRRHKLFGHLFSGRYKSLTVEGFGSGYLKSVCDYVHLNPARGKLVTVDVPLKSLAWSSWPAYLLAPSKRPAWLRVDRLLGEWGIPQGQSGGTATAGASVGRTVRGGGRRGVQTDPARLVSVWGRRRFAKSCWRG